MTLGVHDRWHVLRLPFRRLHYCRRITIGGASTLGGSRTLCGSGSYIDWKRGRVDRREGRAPSRFAGIGHEPVLGRDDIAWSQGRVVLYIK